MAVRWKRGDTPLPWNVGADLTGLTVEVSMRAARNDTAPVFLLQETVLPGAGGDLTVAADDIPEGLWQIEVRGFNAEGVLVMTFPNDGTRQFLHVSPSLDGGVPLPEVGQVDVVLDGGAP